MTRPARLHPPLLLLPPLQPAGDACGGCYRICRKPLVFCRNSAKWRVWLR
jgi:hypothetical protein